MLPFQPSLGKTHLGETVIHHNLGLDLGFFDNRLNLSADLFIRDTKDMLVLENALGVYGATLRKKNAANLRTKGFELAVSWYDQFNLETNRSVTTCLSGYPTANR